MAKWDFKIVGASFVKELVPVGDDVQPRSQSFMQPSFHLEGGKIVMKESGAYVTSIYFSLIGEIDGVAPTDIEDAYAKLLVLVENFNGGGGAPGTTPTLQEVLDVNNTATQSILLNNNPSNDYCSLNPTQLAVADADYGSSLGKQTLVFSSNATTNSASYGVGSIGFSTSGSTLTSISFENPTNINSIVVPDKSGTLATLDDVTGGAWGSITGTLSAQTDLQTALDAKQDDLTAANMHTYVDGLTALTTPVDADRMIIVDNSASLAKKITWANIKSTLKTYFDGFYSSKQPGAFSGTFALDALGGNFYNDLTQVGALTFAAGGSAIVGGSDCVKITANGSAITIPGTFINVGGESISIVNGAINRITVMKTASEIWYTVKVN